MATRLHSARLAALLALIMLFSLLPLTAQASTANITGVSYGSTPANYQYHTYSTYLDQVTTRTDYINATRALRGDMWDQNVPFNGATLRQAAAQQGITTRNQYVNGFTWDASLERIAVQRALETRVHGEIAHKRTVSDSIWSAKYGSQGFNAEVIAWGYSSMYAAVYNGWGHGEVAALKSANGWFNTANGHLHSLINPSLKYHGAAAVGNVDLGVASYSLTGTPNQGGTGWQGTYNLSYAIEGAATGWYNDGANWYFRKADGNNATGWLKTGGKWYWLDSPSGKMATGWRKVGAQWYAFDGSGAMMSGWKYLSGSWYYFNNSGSMVTGWQYVGNGWYYLTSSGAMRTGWLLTGDVWYYLDSSGKMVTGTRVINGVSYTFASWGALL